MNAARVKLNAMRTTSPLVPVDVDRADDARLAVVLRAHLTS